MAPRKNDDMWGAFARYFSVAMLLPASSLVGYAIGYGLDRLFSTHFLNIVFLLLGSVGGFIELVRELNKP
ncbi:MAG: AtpZ/AtpI family protein [Bryobacteraceae bacterium]